MDEKTKTLLDICTDMCLSCAADRDVDACADQKCPLWTVRTGCLPPRKRHGWLLGQIRARCGQCAGGQTHQIMGCESHTCPLWRWRVGSGIPVTSPGSQDSLEALLFDEKGDLAVVDTAGDLSDDGDDIDDILFGDE